ncbi:MAG TPA: hypothetical protein VFU47_13310, partial [Armatimonadota bacterium]|nr:hypothetical protein [Armatimonadota bacterium]
LAYLKRPLPRLIITFVVGLLAEKLVELLSPETVSHLREWNAALLEGAQRVQPWHVLALYWDKLSTLPAGMGPLSVPFYLLGKAVGGGLEVLLVSLANPETAVSTLVGHGLGLYLTWVFFSDRRGELNLYVGIVGTIVLGACCLAILQPLLVLATVLAGALLQVAGGGLVAMASLPIPLARQFAQHMMTSWMEEKLEEVIERHSEPPAPSTVPPEPPGTS